jgi:hypothetical protein
LYRGKRDGFGATAFHSKCDNHSITLTILKSKGNEFIFGGLTTAEWDCSDKYKSDPYAFIFSLTNKDLCHSEIGPTFGQDGHFGHLFIQ